MTTHKFAPKKTPWNTVSAEDWAKGCAHVARLQGVTPTAAGAARKRLCILPQPAPRPRRPVPEGLQLTDSPAAVAQQHGVCVTTASKWLATVGRPRASVGRPPVKRRRPRRA